MSNVIEEARTLKSQAMNARDAGYHERAVSFIEKAEKVLRDALNELKKNRQQGEKPGRLETDVANQLVHVLGSKGGIFRRKKKYKEAAKAYDAGYEEFERPGSGYGIVNSYNLVQRLVSRVLLNPGCVDGEDLHVEGLHVRAALAKAREEIQQQLKGKRAGDEYAAADLALVCLLLGDDDWEMALDDFIYSSPPPEPYAVKVTAELIEELDEAARQPSSPSPALARRLSQATQELRRA